MFYDVRALIADGREVAPGFALQHFLEIIAVSVLILDGHEYPVSGVTGNVLKRDFFHFSDFVINILTRSGGTKPSPSYKVWPKL